MHHFNIFILLSISVLPLAALETNGIVIDDSKAEFTGNWQSVNENPGYGVGPTFRYAMNFEAPDPTCTATFRPNIPVAGKYHVEVASSPGKNRSIKVPCLISCADGEISVIMDQTGKPAGWHRIASDLRFNAGTKGFVQIRNNGGGLDANDRTKIAIADGVRFIPAEENVSSGVELVTTTSVGGTVKTSPKGKTFELNATVTLTALPDDGYIFNGWSGDASGMDNPLRVTMDQTKRIMARFSEGNPGVILDASDATLSGPWLPHDAKWGARANYQVASTCESANAPMATAIYRPTFSKAGLYDVYLWYAKGSNRADNAPWEIAAKKKSFVVKVNQQSKGGEWLSVASGVEFDAGTNGYVKVSNLTGAANSVVVADSVAFVYVGQP